LLPLLLLELLETLEVTELVELTVVVAVPVVVVPTVPVVLLVVCPPPDPVAADPWFDSIVLPQAEAAPRATEITPRKAKF
jgi:hypothetical protein